MPKATQILKTSMRSSIVAPSLNAALRCRRVPGAFVCVRDASLAMRRSSARLGERTLPRSTGAAAAMGA
jgi:hypothetical protein